MLVVVLYNTKLHQIVLQILNHHHLNKKGFRCQWDNQRKKDEGVASRISHLETQSNQEEDKNKMKRKTEIVDNHVDNPQDESGVMTSIAKDDIGDSTFPVGSKSNEAYRISKEALKRLRQRN